MLSKSLCSVLVPTFKLQINVVRDSCVSAHVPLHFEIYCFCSKEKSCFRSWFQGLPSVMAGRRGRSSSAVTAGMSGAGYFSSAVRNSSVEAEPARIPQSLSYILPNSPMSQSFFTPLSNSITSFQTVPVTCGQLGWRCSAD